jgi:hypothetical protein
MPLSKAATSRTPGTARRRAPAQPQPTCPQRASCATSAHGPRWCPLPGLPDSHRNGECAAGPSTACRGEQRPLVPPVTSTVSVEAVMTARLGLRPCPKSSCSQYPGPPAPAPRQACLGIAEAARRTRYGPPARRRHRSRIECVSRVRMLTRRPACLLAYLRVHSSQVLGHDRSAMSRQAAVMSPALALCAGLQAGGLPVRRR